VCPVFLPDPRAGEHRPSGVAFSTANLKSLLSTNLERWQCNSQKEGTESGKRQCGGRRNSKPSVRSFFRTDRESLETSHQRFQVGSAESNPRWPMLAGPRVWEEHRTHYSSSTPLNLWRP